MVYRLERRGSARSCLFERSKVGGICMFECSDVSKQDRLEPQDIAEQSIRWCLVVGRMEYLGWEESRWQERKGFWCRIAGADVNECEVCFRCGYEDGGGCLQSVVCGLGWWVENEWMDARLEVCSLARLGGRSSTVRDVDVPGPKDE